MVKFWGAGIVGIPNVGKSSLINSLKRARVAAVGNTPGVTRTVQEVSLDKQVKLLDSPGIVMAGGSAHALRNAIKVRLIFLLTHFSAKPSAKTLSHPCISWVLHHAG